MRFVSLLGREVCCSVVVRPDSGFFYFPGGLCGFSRVRSPTHGLFQVHGAGNYDTIVPL